MSVTVLFAAEEQTEGSGGHGGDEGWTREEPSLNCWGPSGFLRPGVSQETENRDSSQTAPEQSCKEVAGTAGAAAGDQASGLAERDPLMQDATALSEGVAGFQPLAYLYTGLHASHGSCISNQCVFIKDQRLWLYFHRSLWLSRHHVSHLLYSRALPALLLL